VEKQIPDTGEGARHDEDEVKRDVLLAAQPTKRFVAVEEVAGLAVFSPRRRGIDHRRAAVDRRRLDGAMTPERLTRSSSAPGRLRRRCARGLDKED